MHHIVANMYSTMLQENFWKIGRRGRHVHLHPEVKELVDGSNRKVCSNSAYLAPQLMKEKEDLVNTMFNKGRAAQPRWKEMA